MSYEEVVSDAVRVVEGVGAAIMVIGGFVALVEFAWTNRHKGQGVGSYERLRRNLGRVILVGLEVLIVADIIRTIIVDQTLESVAVLGVVVIIRIILSFSLEVEIDGAWPWQRWRLTSAAATSAER